MESRKRAEQLFDATIREYNKNTNIFGFQFDNKQKEMFINMMEIHARNAMKIGDRITDGTHIAIVETQPTIKADITWLHNDAYVNDADLSNFKTEIE